MGRPGLDPGTLGLKEGSGQYLRSSDVEKVPNKRKTRSLMSAWFSGVWQVRGIKRGIFEEQNRAFLPSEVSGVTRRTETNDTASQANLNDRLATKNDEAIHSSNGAINIPGSDLLNGHCNVVSGVVSAPILLLTVLDAAKLLAVSRSKLYELLNSRAIDSVYIGRSRRIRLVDLESFVNGLDTVS